jgi:guanylate kinase
VFKFKGKGLLVIVSAPSGSGKTTLCKRLQKEQRDIFLSVSYTTRSPRPGEKKGRDYHFISEKKFAKKIDNGFFLEWAKYFGNYYGTPKQPILRALNKGRTVLLSIDVQGREKVAKKIKRTVSVFVVPPSRGDLRKRLKTRKTERQRDIFKRLKIAEDEMKRAKNYDYVVINDDINKALGRIRAIIAAEKCRMQYVKRI